MEPHWLTHEERIAWVRLAALMELLPGVLETQLRRDAGLNYFEYLVLAMLSEAPDRVLRMTALASQTNASLPRLSHVVKRLEQEGLVERSPCPSDRRATNATLTPLGWEKIVAAAPGHVTTVREVVFDPITRAQVQQLATACGAILERMDPGNAMTAFALGPGDGHAAAEANPRAEDPSAPRA